MPTLIHKESQKTLSNEVLLAHSFFSRCKGLIGRSELKQEQCMWIYPCSSIHTFFMKFPIDVIFTDSNLKIHRLYENVKPWRLLLQGPSFLFKNMFQKTSVFEFKAHHLASFSLKKGDLLYVDA